MVTEEPRIHTTEGAEITEGRGEAEGKVQGGVV